VLNRVSPRSCRNLIVAFLLSAAGCSGSEELYPGGELPSPDGQLVASFFALGGGGAAGWLFEYVSIRPSSEPPDAGLREVVLQMNYGYEVCLNWRSNQHLEVSVPEGAGIHQQKTSLTLSRPITVSFFTVPAASGSIEGPCSGTKIALQSPSAS
jgi:hypothetical protein